MLHWTTDDKKKNTFHRNLSRCFITTYLAVNLTKIQTLKFYLIEDVVARSLRSQFDQISETLRGLLQLALPLPTTLHTHTSNILESEHHCYSFSVFMR